MVQLSRFLALTFLAGIGFSAPTEKSTKDILIAAYGPLDGWTPVKLIDVFPDALIDGVPANSSVIYSLQPPNSTTKAQRDLASSLLSARSSSTVEKRDSLSCYNSGAYVFQDQLQAGKNTFCNDARDYHQPQNGQTWGDLRYFFFDGSNWVPFINSGGQVTSVYYEITVNGGYLFNWDVCFNAFWTVIADCPGANPDSAGGVLYGFNGGQVNVRLDPVD